MVTASNEIRGARSDHAWLSIATPLFTSLGPNAPIDALSIETRVAAAADLGADALMCFIESDGYALWPSDVVRRSPRLGDGLDAVGVLAEATRARGMRFIPMWMGCHCQTLHIREHPSWLQRDASGAANASMCVNSPFGGSLLEQVREVVTRYDPDGIYFDGIYARVGGCYCVYCRKRFRALHGHDIPLRTASLEATDIEAREHWIGFGVEPEVADAEHDAFRRSTVTDYLRRVRATLDATNGAALLLDTLGATSAYYTNGHDIPAMAESVDAFLLESYWEHQGEPVVHVAFEADIVRAESGRPLWWARWLARHPDGDQVSVPAATVRTWAAQNVVHDARPAAAEQNLFTVDERLRTTLASVTAEARELVDRLAGTDLVADVALLHSPGTKAAVYADWRPRDYLDALEGTHQVLAEQHLGYRVVLDTDLDAERLAGFRVVVAPNVMRLAPGSAEALARFVEDGGGLVATYLTGVFDEYGPRDGGVLDELLGIRGMGINERSGRVGPETFGGREPVSYLRAEAGELPFGAGAYGSFKEPYRIARVRDGARAVASVLTSDYRLMDGDQFFSWFPGVPESPYLVVSERGRGRVAWFAADPGSSLFHNGADQPGSLLADAIRWAAGAPPIVGIDAPPTVDVSVRREPVTGRLHVILANRTSHDLFATGRPGMLHSGPNGETRRMTWTRAIVPVAGIGLRLPGLGGASVASLRGAEVRTSADEGALLVELPRLDDLDVLTIG
jgi:hypothetical protein